MARNLHSRTRSLTEWYEGHRIVMEIYPYDHPRSGVVWVLQARNGQVMSELVFPDASHEPGGPLHLPGTSGAHDYIRDIFAAACADLRLRTIPNSPGAQLEAWYNSLPADVHPIRY